MSLQFCFLCNEIRNNISANTTLLQDSILVFLVIIIKIIYAMLILLTCIQWRICNELLNKFGQTGTNIGRKLQNTC